MLVRQTEPDVGPLIDEHFDDFDELLIHLLMADLLRFTVQRFHQGDLASSDRVVGIVNRGWLEGDDALVNAVAVSFVEHVGTGPGETRDFIASWPPALLEERHRQMDSPNDHRG